MSDDTVEAISKAMALNRKLAGSLLVRKQELEALPEGDPARAELPAVTAQLEAVKKELDQLVELSRRHRAPSAAAVLAGGDPLVDAALEKARREIAETEALAGGAVRPAAPTVTREDADAQARDEFEALRAKQQGKPKKTL